MSPPTANQNPQKKVGFVEAVNINAININETIDTEEQIQMNIPQALKRLENGMSRGPIIHHLIDKLTQEQVTMTFKADTIWCQNILSGRTNQRRFTRKMAQNMLNKQKTQVQLGDEFLKKQKLKEKEKSEKKKNETSTITVSERKS